MIYDDVHLDVIDWTATEEKPVTVYLIYSWLKLLNYIFILCLAERSWVFKGEEWHRISNEMSTLDNKPNEFYKLSFIPFIIVVVNQGVTFC